MSRETELLRNIVKAYNDNRFGLDLAITDARDWLNDPRQKSPEAEAYRNAVPVSDGDLECDDGAIVSFSEDGAYVQTWSWVSDNQAGLDPVCDECGERYSDGGDGLCPDCADREHG